MNQPFDYVITASDNAKEMCPVSVGQVKHRLHLGLEDPAEARGTDDHILSVFRRIRDEIKEAFRRMYTQTLKQE